jgi:RNA polymerase sigma-70 factor (ECF subfamily)
MNQSQLLHDCLKGKTYAQRELYALYAHPMLGLCYRYTKSMADAEDVLQEGFIKVFKNLHQFNGSGELGAWIRRIMVNSAINYLKKGSRYQYDLSFSDQSLHPVSDENPELILNAKELADLIRQLPTGYQTVFNLHAVEGYSHGEIGNILGIHEGTSKSQYARARALLISWITKNSLDQKTGIYARK